MKLAILGPYPINGDVNKINGGVEAVIVNMVKGLSGFKDLDIQIITASFSIDREKDFVSNGINVHAVPLERRFGNIMFYSKTRKMLSGKIDELKPDLVHAHIFRYYTLAALAGSCKKVVVSSHGLPSYDWGLSCGIRDRVRRYSESRIYARCIKGADNIIINSPFAKEVLGGLLDNKKVYELNNPVSDAFFNIDNSAEEENKVLFAGNISEAKGIMTLLEAIGILKKDFRDIRLAIAGDFKDRDFYHKLNRLIKENDLEGAVSFLGRLDDNGLKEEYGKASVFAFPSNEDVAPLSLLQAMAGAKAIVASRVGGIPYMIDNGISGFLIEKKDHNALAEKIGVLLRDSGLRRKLGFAAREKTLKGYSIDSVTGKLYSIYKDLLC